MQHVYQFKNNINEITICDIYIPKTNIATPFVMLIHGFRAFRDWGFFPYFAEKLSNQGFIAASIDFSLNALIDREKSIFDMEKFAKNTVTQEITEAKMFFDILYANPAEILGNDNLSIWNGEVYMIGHSLGGAIAIMAAENNPLIKKLVTINSIYDFDIYTERQKTDWVAKGFKKIVDSTTQQTFVLDVNFLLDRLKYVNDKSVLQTVSRLNIPILVLHGEADATVSPKAAEKIFASVQANNKAEKVYIPNASHTFGITHPFEKSNSTLDKTIDIVINFLEKE